MSYSEIEVRGKLSAAEAIQRVKKIRWALRSQLGDRGDRMLGSLQSGSLLEVAVRPHGETATIRVWFVSANRRFSPGEEAFLEGWMSRMMKAFEQRGWAALEEE